MSLSCPNCGTDTEVKKTTDVTDAVIRIRACKSCSFVGASQEGWVEVGPKKNSANAKIENRN